MENACLSHAMKPKEDGDAGWMSSILHDARKRHEREHIITETGSEIDND